MSNFNRSRKPLPTSLGAMLAVLALGPLRGLAGCSTYSSELLDGASPLASGGSGSAAAAGAEQAGSAGSAPGGSSSASGGTKAEGGEAGTGVAGSGASGGDARAGNGGSSAGMAGSGGEAGNSISVESSSIDDMEDDDAQIALAEGRNGYWYVGNDGSVGGTQEPTVGAFAMAELEAGERAASSFAAHMKVSGFKSWGAVLGFNFVEQLGKVQPYDASGYCGVRFWAKAAAATTLRFRLPDADTHPAGEVCVDGGGAGEACHDHFSTSAALGTSWKKFDVPFAELQQIGSGYHPADMKFKADQLFSLEWALPGSGKDYEIWIDDVEFLSCN